ncbi:MAG: tautomerase family protein [Thermodesulfobacteriota bacterium]
MPHVIVKLYPGRSEELKQRLTEAIARDVVSIIQCPETAVSVAFEEVPQADWPEKVYRPDILGKEATLYLKPGYKNPFD